MVQDHQFSVSTFPAPASETVRYLKLQNCVIGIDGIICSGKTTLIKKICAHLESINNLCAAHFENPNPTLLGFFYKKPQKYAFLLQTDMLMKRQHVHQLALCSAGKDNYLGLVPVKTKSVWMDRTILGDSTFAKLAHISGNITDVDYVSYKSNMKNGGPYPHDYIVFLDVDPNIASDRNLTIRKNKEEQGIPLAYLQDLRKHYYIKLRKSAICDQGARILIVRNNDYVTPEMLLDMIIRCPSIEMVKYIFEYAPIVTVDSTPSEVDEAFEYVHAQYLKYNVSH